ncbi:MAG TPA: 50S ribosomal protein L35 [Synergistales bacterium]|nr:50S ribosomal protein L35 [Synergistales bacterium]
MPKIKSHSGSKKRFSYTGSGKISYKKNGRGHLLRKKNSRRLRRLRDKGYLGSSHLDTMRKLLPYG